MNCFVYKSLRRAETYVYLRERDAFQLLPATLAATLGPLNFVIELALSPERKLAREDVETVIANLRGPGFHLQLPPPPVETTQ
ncbi:MAG TPA: YcgL domain-containing protein [Tahibacter sp.]|uniref:YcgL domain-containing protein n=1 Tax=Tahibacter sp. TaxID=2056211 RepID=UPI002C75A775|nr:YcgL domain-containing protein [Tahibacter sp.]HSX60581.1 YcgL domain-containing protein [Tahibacter sp.]